VAEGRIEELLLDLRVREERRMDAVEQLLALRGAARGLELPEDLPRFRVVLLEQRDGVLLRARARRLLPGLLRHGPYLARGMCLECRGGERVAPPAPGRPARAFGRSVD